MSKSNQKISKILVISLLVLIASNIFVFFLIKPSFAQANEAKNILFISKGNDDSLVQSLGIDKENFNITAVSDSDPLVSIGSWVDTVILFDVQFNSSEQQIISNFVDTGGSAIVFMGQNLHENATLLDELEVIDNTLFEAGKSKNQEIMLSIVYNGTYSISKNIDWNSAPEMKVNNMTIIPLASLNSSVKRIVDVYPASRNLQIDLYRQPLMVERTKGSGKVFAFSGWLETDANLDFKVWPYFNYLLYGLIFESLDSSFQTYPVWPYSPVPHLLDQIIIGVIIVILAVLAIALFIVG